MTRRALATLLVPGVLLTAAACSKETEGKASPSGTAESSTSESSSDESSSDKSSSGKSSSGSAPAGTIEASDGSLYFTAPAGYEDALDKLNTAGALAAVYDPASDATLPTHIVVSSETTSASLDDLVKAAQDQVEKKFNTTVTTSNPPVSEVDGEELKAWTTEAYKDGADDVATAQILTKHDGKAYYFTVNTAPANVKAAGAALIELVESVTWE